MPSSSPSGSTFYFLISTLSAVSPAPREMLNNYIMPPHDSICLPCQKSLSRSPGTTDVSHGGAEAQRLPAGSTPGRAAGRCREALIPKAFRPLQPSVYSLLRNPRWIIRPAMLAANKCHGIRLQFCTAYCHKSISHERQTSVGPSLTVNFNARTIHWAGIRNPWCLEPGRFQMGRLAAFADGSNPALRNASSQKRLSQLTFAGPLLKGILSKLWRFSAAVSEFTPGLHANPSRRSLHSRSGCSSSFNNAVISSPRVFDFAS